MTTETTEARRSMSTTASTEAIEDEPQDLPLWERIEGETDKAWAAFEAFRDLGRLRTIESAYRAIQDEAAQNGAKRREKAPSNWRDWAKLNDWHARAAAWDQEQASLRAVEIEAARRAQVEKLLNDLHRDSDQTADAARIMLRKALERFKTIDMTTYPAEKMPQLITSLARLLAICGDLRYSALGLDELAAQYLTDQKDETT